MGQLRYSVTVTLLFLCPAEIRKQSVDYRLLHFVHIILTVVHKCRLFLALDDVMMIGTMLITYSEAASVFIVLRMAKFRKRAQTKDVDESIV